MVKWRIKADGCFMNTVLVKCELTFKIILHDKSKEEDIDIYVCDGECAGRRGHRGVPGYQSSGTHCFTAV